MNDPEWRALPIPPDVRARCDAEARRLMGLCRLPWRSGPGIIPERVAVHRIMAMRAEVAENLSAEPETGGDEE